MKILSDNAVTKDNLNSIELKLIKQVKLTRVLVSVLFVVNVALTVALRFLS